ncbi:uncharacterized protein LOC144665861 [Oculina patagonica]
MKAFLVVCLLASVIMAAHGYRRQTLEDLYNDEALEALEGTRDEPSPDFKERLIVAPRGQEGGNNDTCNCPAECDKLHLTRLPQDVRKIDNYLSYENFPVLCRDASAIMLPPRSENKPQNKYVCKEMFDCCRRCNQAFYICLRQPGNSYGFCMRAAYKCMCDCIDKKSFGELPYKPAKPSK